MVGSPKNGAIATSSLPSPSRSATTGELPTPSATGGTALGEREVGFTGQPGAMRAVGLDHVGAPGAARAAEVRRAVDLVGADHDLVPPVAVDVGDGGAGRDGLRRERVDAARREPGRRAGSGTAPCASRRRARRRASGRPSRPRSRAGRRRRGRRARAWRGSPRRATGSGPARACRMVAADAVVGGDREAGAHAWRRRASSTPGRRSAPTMISCRPSRSRSATATPPMIDEYESGTSPFGGALPSKAARWRAAGSAAGRCGRGSRAARRRRRRTRVHLAVAVGEDDLELVVVVEVDQRHRQRLERAVELDAGSRGGRAGSRVADPDRHAVLAAVAEVVGDPETQRVDAVRERRRVPAGALRLLTQAGGGERRVSRPRRSRSGERRERYRLDPRAHLERPVEGRRPAGVGVELRRCTSAVDLACTSRAR